MDTVWKAIIWHQLGATIQMFENTLRACPDQLWCERLHSESSPQPEFSEFWYVAYYTLFWLDDKYTIFDVQEGNWAGEALVVDNLRSGTTFRFEEQDFFSRMTWHEITTDEFRVKSELSMDAGKTWFTQAKGHYVRKR